MSHNLEEEKKPEPIMKMIYIVIYSLPLSLSLSTYFVRVAQTKSAGSVAGSESACRILVPL